MCTLAVQTPRASNPCYYVCSAQASFLLPSTRPTIGALALAFLGADLFGGGGGEALRPRLSGSGTRSVRRVSAYGQGAGHPHSLALVLAGTDLLLSFIFLLTSGGNRSGSFGASPSLPSAPTKVFSPTGSWQDMSIAGARWLSWGQIQEGFGAVSSGDPRCSQLGPDKHIPLYLGLLSAEAPQ